MSAKTCEVCGREVGHMSDEHMGTCGRKAQEGFGNPASACYRLGCEREKAANKDLKLTLIDIAEQVTARDAK